MGDFNRGGGFGGGRGRSFGDKRGFNNRGSSRPTMHKAICSKCGKECEVPFRPTGEKPVYCRDCFREINGEPRRNDDRSFSRPQFDNKPAENNQYKDQLAALSVKVDKILSILESTVTPKDNSTEGAEQPAVPEKKKRSPKKSS